METGQFLSQNTDRFNSLSLDALAKSEQYGEDIPLKQDIAHIKRRPKYMPIYFVKNDGQRQKIILPVYGKGLWSTLYGLLALESDAKTIAGITFYQQGETPGLGGEISNPRWQKLWQGKQAFDANDNVAIQVIKGEVLSNSPTAIYQVDGLAGATLTSRGVNNLVRYWLGHQAYGPFLQTLRRQDDE